MVPLFATGLPPPTHYAGIGDVTNAFVKLVEAGRGGYVSPGANPALVQVLNVVTLDYEESWVRPPHEHFSTVLEARGLARVVGPTP
jgi:hypothetical protein